MKSKVYVIQGYGCVKVGRSADPAKRVKQLSQSHPGGVTLCYETERLDHAGYVEATAHQTLHRHRISNEWFSCSVEEATAAVEAAVSWTSGRGPSSVLTMRINSELLQGLRELSGEMPVQHYIVDALRRVVQTAQ